MGNRSSSSGWSRCLFLLAAWLCACCGGAEALAPAEAPARGQASSGHYGYSAEEDSATAEESLDTDSLSVEALSVEKSSSRGREAPVARSSPPPPSVVPTPQKPFGTSPALAKGAPESVPDASTASAGALESRGPLLVYSATVTLAVFGLESALDAVEQLARARHGYLVRRSDTSIVVRVPAAGFHGALAGVSKLGDELHRDVSAEDVTEQYADLEIRLRNAEVVRQRLEVLLAKAASVEDALAVERELARVTQSIEQLKGKLKLLGELVRFSTITVNFQARGVERVNSRTPLPFDWLKDLGLSHLLSL
jgi:hypothetical protein